MRGEGVWDIPSLLQSMVIDNILMFLRRKIIVTMGKLHEFNFLSSLTEWNIKVKKSNLNQ